MPEPYRIAFDHRRKAAAEKIASAVSDMLLICCGQGFYGDFTLKMNFQDGVPILLETSPRQQQKVKPE